MESDLDVHNRAGPQGKGAFTVERGSEHLGTLTYERDASRITLIDTAISEAIQGQGVGAALVRAAVSFADEADLEVAVVCPWAIRYLARHPELLGDSDGDGSSDAV